MERLKGSAIQAVLAIALSACVDINGGAVEVAWTIIDPDGNEGGPAVLPCDDDSARIERVRLIATPCNEVTTTGACCESLTGAGECVAPVPVHTGGGWECGPGRGATNFDIPAGRYAFRIEVECAPDDQGNRDPDPDVRVPDPVIREVFEGDIVNLKAQMIALPTGTGAACD